MSKIITPKQNKLSDAEDIALPTVKCSFCGKQTTTGMHQTRLEILEKGVIKVINGKKMYKPPKAKEINYYMCPTCIAKGAKWPGVRP